VVGDLRPRAGVHYPRSTGEFQSWFATDADCLDFLDWLRRPGGFVCPECGRGGGAIWWPDLPAGQQRTAALRLLGAWVDDVLHGHHPELFHDSLQACWYRHADVLDELTALRAAWYAAYRGKAAPATAAIEWHDRWLPGCMARCKAAIRARPCDQDGHRSPPGTGASGDSVAVQEFTGSGSGGPQAPGRHRPRGRPARAGGQAKKAKPPATDHGQAVSPRTAPG
jgi:hypothetical protein